MSCWKVKIWRMRKKGEGNTMFVCYTPLCFQFLIRHYYQFFYVRLTNVRKHGSAQSDSIRDRCHSWIHICINCPTDRPDGRTDGRVCLLFSCRKWWNWHTFPIRSVNLFYMCAPSVDTQSQLRNSSSVIILRLSMQPMHWNLKWWIHWISCSCASITHRFRMHPIGGIVCEKIPIRSLRWEQ